MYIYVQKAQQSFWSQPRPEFGLLHLQAPGEVHLQLCIEVMQLWTIRKTRKKNRNGMLQGKGNPTISTQDFRLTGRNFGRIHSSFGSRLRSSLSSDTARSLDR